MSFQKKYYHKNKLKRNEEKSLNQKKGYFLFNNCNLFLLVNGMLPRPKKKEEGGKGGGLTHLSLTVLAYISTARVRKTW